MELKGGLSGHSTDTDTCSSVDKHPILMQSFYELLAINNDIKSNLRQIKISCNKLMPLKGMEMKDDPEKPSDDSLFYRLNVLIDEYRIILNDTDEITKHLREVIG